MRIREAMKLAATGETGCADQSTVIFCRNKQDKAVRMHWYNHGPKLLEALDDCECELNSGSCATALETAREVLLAASQVEMP